MTKTRILDLTLIFGFIFLVSTSAFGQGTEQKTFSKELSIISDNDFYLLRKKDGYYTNGLMFNFSAVAKNDGRHTFKKINHFEAGQLIFNQGSRKIQDVALIDRPITGYLYGKFTQTNFIRNNRFYQWGASVGTVGKAALGENMHDFFHRQINVNSNHWGWIWNYELHNEVGVNLHGTYATSLIKKEHASFQLTPQLQATLGTTFTNITPGIVMQAGKFNSVSESSYWGAAIQNRRSAVASPAEYYFFYHPHLMYQLYNATIQGGMFRDDKGPITSSVEPLVFVQEAGFVLSKPRYSFSYRLTYQTREARSQKANHAYGRVQVTYRFN